MSGRYHWAAALVCTGVGLFVMVFSSGISIREVSWFSPELFRIGLSVALVGLALLIFQTIRGPGDRKRPLFVAGAVLFLGFAVVAVTVVFWWHPALLWFGVTLAVIGAAGILGLLRGPKNAIVIPVFAALVLLVAGLLTALATVGLSPPVIEWVSPHLFRIGFVLTLAGLMWWIAECFGLLVMRIAAVLAGLAVALALINVGDDKRIAIEDDAYLSMRAAVGNELANVLPIGDPPAAPAETATDVATTVPVTTTPSAATTTSTATTTTSTATTSTVAPTTAAEVIVEEDATVRARDRGQTELAAEGLNRAVLTADTSAVACPAVRVRLVGGGLGPLVVLEEPAAVEIEPRPGNLIATATGFGEDAPPPASPEDVDGRSDPASDEETTAAERRDVNTFLDLLVATGLTSELTGEGPFTVFVPPATEWNLLLDELNLDGPPFLPGQHADNRALVAAVGHHIVLGRIGSAELPEVSGTSVPTLADDSALMSSDGEVVLIDRTNIEDRDMIVASNGVVHRISAVLQPEQNLILALDSKGSYKKFLEGLEATGLATELGGRDQFTVFAPSDAVLAEWEHGENLNSPEGRRILEQLIVMNSLSRSELAARDGNEIESLRGTALRIDNRGDEDRPVLEIEGSRIDETSIEATNGVIHPIDEVYAERDEGDCQPRVASVELLALLRGELVGASTRTSNEGTQQQLGDRITEVDSEIADIQADVAVHGLVIDGADALVGESIDFAVEDDVSARLGGWGWLVVMILLVLGYRRFEIINGRREPGPVRVEPVPDKGLSATVLEDARRATVIIENRLGQAEVREPASLPGGDSTRQVAEVAQDAGLPGGDIAQAIAGFFQNTAFPEKGVSIAVTVERIGEDDRKRVRLTARVSEIRNKRLLYSQPFEAASVEEAADQAAHFVAANQLAQSRTVAPWAKWPDDDGTGLRAYQEVALDERTRKTRYGPVTRRNMLYRSVAACPYSGVARVALGQQLQVVGPAAENDADFDETIEPRSAVDRAEIGRSLVTGIPQLGWATSIFPELLIAHYRLAASFSMLAEDVDAMWLSDDKDLPRPKTGGQNPPLGAAEVTDEVVDVLGLPARHRRTWTAGQIDGRRDRPPTERPRRWLHARLNRLRDWLGITSNTGPRTAEMETVEQPPAPPVESDVQATGQHAEHAELPDPDTEGSAPADLADPSAMLLLRLARQEVETGLFELRRYPWIRTWRQAERSYWLALLTDRGRRKREEAAFRILGEIILLREHTCGEAKIERSSFRRIDDRVDRLHAEHRDDAVVCYVTAAFNGVVLNRMRKGAIAGLVTDREENRERARKTIRLLRDARNASNGYVISTRWVMRDPDLWEVRDEVPVEWTALIRRFEWLDKAVDGPLLAQHDDASIEAVETLRAVEETHRADIDDTDAIHPASVPSDQGGSHIGRWHRWRPWWRLRRTRKIDHR